MHRLIVTFNLHLMDIYIAPLQEIYSEALPTPAQRKRTVLRLERKTDEMDPRRRRSSRGSPFQFEGPRTEKAWFCLMEVRANGTWRRPCSDERSDLVPPALRIVQQSSCR